MYVYQQYQQNINRISTGCQQDLLNFSAEERAKEKVPPPSKV